MKLININENLAKKYLNADKTILYCKLLPYKENTCIKVYTEEGEPIGDVEESCVNEYLSKETLVLFISEKFDDNTGLFEIIIKDSMI